MKITNKSGFSLERKFYSMVSSDGLDAEITMYGEIVEEQPRDWWGDPIEGEFIVQSEFLADLEKAAKCRSITFRLNSLGGDSGVSILIHNRIRELSANGVKTVCVVDGVAMSGGSIIMCACDEVRVNPSSLIMIHKCWSILWGGYNADELRKAAEHQDAVDKAQASVYTRKTGLSETQILHMMADTTYMTGKEAVEKHFADKLIEDAAPVPIAASADGRTLFVAGREFHLAPGMSAPDWVETVQQKAEPDPEPPATEPDNQNPAATGSPAPLDISQPGEPGANEGGVFMTLEELRAQYPDLIAEAERTAAAQATASERQRLEEIDNVAASIGDADMVREARFGQTACDARELAYRAAVKSAKKGGQFLAAMTDEAKAAAAVASAAAPAPSAAKTEEQMMEEARQFAKSLENL